MHPCNLAYTNLNSLCPEWLWITPDSPKLRSNIMTDPQYVRIAVPQFLVPQFSTNCWSSRGGPILGRFIPEAPHPRHNLRSLLCVPWGVLYIKRVTPGRFWWHFWFWSQPVGRLPDLNIHVLDSPEQDYYKYHVTGLLSRKIISSVIISNMIICR